MPALKLVHYLQRYRVSELNTSSTVTWTATDRIKPVIVDFSVEARDLNKTTPDVGHDRQEWRVLDRPRRYDHQIVNIHGRKGRPRFRYSPEHCLDILSLAETSYRSRRYRVSLSIKFFRTNTSRLFRDGLPHRS